MKLSLVVLNEGKLEGQTIPVKLAQFIIGRDPQCNLRPASPLISKRHCALLVKNGKVFIRDFGSTNGTFLNNEQVKGERQVQNQDILKVGPLTFKVALETSVPVDKPTPLPPKMTPKTDADSMAAMLLSVEDEDSSDSTAPPAVDSDESSVPAGSTVMDIVPLQEAVKAAAEKEATVEAEKKPEPKKPAPPPGDARQAAKAILEKFIRRQRS